MQALGVDIDFYITLQKQVSFKTLFPEFGILAKEVLDAKKTSMRTYRLISMADILDAMPEGENILEVGVYKGGTSKFMMNYLESRGNHFNFSALIPLTDTLHHTQRIHAT